MTLVDICRIVDNSNWVTDGFFRIMFMIFSLLFSLSSFSVEGVVLIVVFDVFLEMADNGKANSTISNSNLYIYLQ